MDAVSYPSPDEERSLEVLDKRLRKLGHRRADLGKTVNIAWPPDAYTALTEAVGMYRYLKYKQTREHIAGIGQVEQVLLNDRLARVSRAQLVSDSSPRSLSCMTLGSAGWTATSPTSPVRAHGSPPDVWPYSVAFDQDTSLLTHLAALRRLAARAFGVGRLGKAEWRS